MIFIKQTRSYFSSFGSSMFFDMQRWGLVACAGVSLMIAHAYAPAVNAANPGPGSFSEQTIARDVALLENRFFNHLYASDPMDKRLERLELMTFGGTQTGSLDSRCSRLKKLVAERPQMGSVKTAPVDESASTPRRYAASESSAQYPILNTLEWRACKKTYPGESLDDRLARLEKKLFGQDSPTMAYVDRVDRLKRTVGIDMAAVQPGGIMGPAPKARARQQADEDDFDSFDEMPTFGNGSLFGPGFGSQNSPFPNVTRAFSQMFQDMNREMQEFKKLGPGTWTYDSHSGDWIEQDSGKKVHPGPAGPGQPQPNFQISPMKPAKPFVIPGPQMMQPPTFRFPRRESQNSDLPPYTDPNSI